MNRTAIVSNRLPSLKGMEVSAGGLDLEALSGRINARHAELDRAPVRYINRAFSQPRLAALYRLSRAGLVTPLRDGMNLVAKPLNSSYVS